MSAAAKIGLVMLLALVVLGVFIIQIEDIPIGERGERLEIAARLPSVAGLDEKSPVRIAGVRVGTVEEVGLDDDNRPIVRISLQPDIELHRGSTARIASLGMLGDSYLEIVPGDPGAPLLEDGAVLSGAASPSFDQVMRSAATIGDDVQEITASLRATIGGPEGAARLDEIVTNLQEMTRSLNDVVRSNRTQVDTTLANFEAFSGTLRSELPRIADKMNELADGLNALVSENRTDIDASVGNIRELTGRLQTTADNLNDITGRIRDGEGSIGQLVAEDRTIDNVNDTLESIRGGVDTIRDTVGRVQRYELDMVMRTEALPSAEENRSAAGFDLWTTDRRFYRAQVVSAPFGEEETETEIVTIEHGDGTVDSYTRTTTTVEDDISFNAQVGWVLFPRTVVRAGLFESAGGVGVDHTVEVRSRPLRLTAEAYDFDRDTADGPHLRFEGRYFMSDNLFVSAGWDDPADSERSSVLLGGGVTWNDEDVKYLLGLVGSAF